MVGGAGWFNGLRRWSDPRSRPRADDGGSRPDLRSLLVEFISSACLLILNCKPISYCRFERIKVYIL